MTFPMLGASYLTENTLRPNYNDIENHVLLGEAHTFSQDDVKLFTKFVYFFNFQDVVKF